VELSSLRLYTLNTFIDIYCMYSEITLLDQICVCEFSETFAILDKAAGHLILKRIFYTLYVEIVAKC
jgi:hypothetical protein